MIGFAAERDVDRRVSDPCWNALPTRFDRASARSDPRPTAREITAGLEMHDLIAGEMPVISSIVWPADRLHVHGGAHDRDAVAESSAREVHGSPIKPSMRVPALRMRDAVFACGQSGPPRHH